MLLFPREHGAYSQMTLPLVTSYVTAGASLPSALTGLAVILGFLAHEPLMVLLGRRGARVSAQSATGARRALALMGIPMIAVGVAALVLSPAPARWAFVLPAIPAAVVAAGLFTKREKSAPAEVAVALAFSFAAVPICLAAGMPPAKALSIGVAFAVVFVAGTLAVRVVILRVRAGGDPRAVRTTRAMLMALAAGAIAGFLIPAARGALSWAPLFAVTPGLIAAIVLAVRPAIPKLRTVGWTLMSTSTAAAVILIALS